MSIESIHHQFGYSHDGNETSSNRSHSTPARPNVISLWELDTLRFANCRAGVEITPYVGQGSGIFTPGLCPKGENRQSGRDIDVAPLTVRRRQTTIVFCTAACIHCGSLPIIKRSVFDMGPRTSPKSLKNLGRNQSGNTLPRQERKRRRNKTRVQITKPKTRDYGHPLTANERIRARKTRQHEREK